MSQFLDARFVITLTLISLFGFAYIQDPSDQAMKGAIIGAFSAAYGFWIGSKNNEKSTENTGKAFDAIKAAQESIPFVDSEALRPGDTVKLEEPQGERDV